MKFAATLFLLVLLNPTLMACQIDNDGHWPAWRGPTMNGHAAAAANPPTEWSESKNIKWKTELPGLGNSTPNVWGDKIILTTAIPTGRTVESRGKDSAGETKPVEFHQLMVLAYDLETGEEIWKTEVSEAIPHSVHHQTGSFASASTVTDGQKIFAFFGSLGLYALDMDGNQIWKYELPVMETVSNFGEGASPVLHQNILIIPWDGEGQSFVAGVDASTGKEVWKTMRETNSSWSTPLIVKDGDEYVAVVSGSNHTRAYDVQSGEELWSCGGMSSNPTSSPVADDNVVFVGNSFRGNVIQAIDFQEATGDLTQTPKLLWTHRGSASYVPTPVVVDGKLYFLRGSRGILNCLDVKTGEPVNPGKRIGLKNVHASPLVAANRIYISSREGDTVVIDPDQDCKILANNHLDDVFDASPIAIGNSLILRGKSNLYCIE